MESERWRRPREAVISAACAIALSCGARVATAQVRVDDSRAEARNDWPVDALILTYASGTKSFVTTRVPARGSAQLTGGATELLSVEPISIQVGRPAIFRSCGVGQAPKADVSRIVSELQAIDFLETASAREKLEAESSLQRINLDQHADEQATYRNDPLRNELRRQSERYQTEGEKNMTRVQDTVRDLGSDITARALAWSEVEEKRLQILHDQLHTLEPLVQQAKLAIQIREEELAAYTRTVAAWQSYSAAVARTLDAGSATGADLPIAASSVRKYCDGPSSDWDTIEVNGPDRSDASVLIAEVSFDRGGRELTHLRRLSKTTGWAGRIDWPSGSTTATLRIRWPGSTRWAQVKGKLNVERKSVDSTVAQARRAAVQIEKKMKETNFRAAGGDRTKTAPVF